MAEQEKKVTEYRVVGERPGHGLVSLYTSESLGFIEDAASPYYDSGTYSNVRIEARTVTYSPWEAVNQGG